MKMVDVGVSIYSVLYICFSTSNRPPPTAGLVCLAKAAESRNSDCYVGSRTRLPKKYANLLPYLDKLTFVQTTD